MPGEREGGKVEETRREGGAVNFRGITGVWRGAVCLDVMMVFPEL